MTTQINILNKLTKSYKKTIVHAYGLSLAKKKKSIEPIDLLQSLVNNKGSLASEVLTKVGIKLSATKQATRTRQTIELEKIFSPANQQAIHAIKNIIIKSVEVAAKHNHQYIGTEHLLHSLVTAKDEKVLKTLTKFKTNPKVILNHLKSILGSTSNFPNMTQTINAIKQKVDKHQKGLHQKEESLLDFFGQCLTDQAVQKKIDPVIGREQELNRIIQILSRKNKNNPILLGEPGVGKTAIIEGLAKKIMQGNVPDILLTKNIYSLDIPLLVAGTSYRGEFEARIKQIVDEVKKNPDIILFIDEIHNIMGAGSASGTMDAANILKPALARGEIRCIGATTYNDYKKHIEPDTALCRRFQSVKVDEPTTQETIDIIHGIKESFIKHHGLDITDEAILQAVYLSDRYITDQFQPDKSIDLIDEALAKKKLSQPGNKNYQQLINLEKELEDIFEQKKDLILKEKYKEALEIKTKEFELINQIYKLEEKKLQNNLISKSLDNHITKKDITAIVAASTKIDIPDSSQPKKNLKNLTKKLKTKIVGQDKILEDLVIALQRSAIGLSGQKRPLGSFIFTGPSGVGKTYIAETLAQTIFPSKQNLIRLDMSEFNEKFNASKMLGAPAGYVGYTEGGTLTEKVKRNPHSVVLFDEIEKAHPDIFNILLQILEDGHLTDAKGKTINFKNTIIIITTNIGLKKSNENDSIGFDNSNQIQNNNFLESLHDLLRPELINRIDQLLVFQPLSAKSIKKIIELELQNINHQLKHQNLVINWDKKVIDHLVKDYTPKEGARYVRKILRHKIENPLTTQLIEGNLKNNTASIKVQNNTIIIN